MHPRRPAVLGSALAGSLLLGGCAAFSDTGSGSLSTSGRPTVVAAFYPLQYVSERVAGDLADVSDLTHPGAEPHDLELSIRQTAEVQEATVVVYEKGLQAAVDSAVDQRGGGATVDAARIAGLEPLSPDGHDDAPDLGDLDPHFWQDPLKLAKVGDAVAAELSEVDPAHASTYAANAAVLTSDLQDLDRAFTSGLADCERQTIVVSHNAFGYLGRYGLHLEPIAGLSPDAEPTPADLARLQTLIRDDGITTVFGERLVSPRLAETLADDLGVGTAILDPIEGLTDQTSDQDYLSLMRQNLAALERANSCR